MRKAAQLLVSAVPPKASDHKTDVATPYASVSPQEENPKEELPVSAFSEPSEPSQLSPAENPKEQITGEQEENPQVVLTIDDKSHHRAKL